MGYFRYGLSNALKEALIGPPLSFRLNNEASAELFYNFAIKRWCGLTADFQVHPPTLATMDTVVFGAYE